MSQRSKNFLAILPCLLAIIVDSLGWGLVYPIITAVFTDAHSTLLSKEASSHLRDFYMGLAYLLWPLCMFFGASFLGDLSDNYGRKKVILACMVGLFFSFLCMGFGMTFSSLFLFLLGRALSGLMAGSQPIAQAAIADLSTKETKAINMSIISLTVCIGVVIGPFIGGVFSDKSLLPFFGFSFPFFLAALVALLTFFWILYGFKETFIPKEVKKIDFSRPITIFADAVKHKKIRSLALVFFFFQVAFGLYFQTILILLREHFKYPSWKLGAFTGFLGVVLSVGILLIAPYVVKKYRAEAIIVWSFLIQGLGLILSCYHHQAALIWFLAIPIGLANILAYTEMLASFSNAVDDKMQGWAMGISAAVVAVSFVFVGLSTNLLPFFGPDFVIVIGGFLFFIAAWIYWTLFYVGSYQKIK